MIPKAMIDDFGRVKIFNLMETLPALMGVIWVAWRWFGQHSVEVPDLVLFVASVGVSLYLIILRAVSFLIALVTMVSAFMPLLKMLQDNARP